MITDPRDTRVPHTSACDIALAGARLERVCLRAALPFVRLTAQTERRDLFQSCCLIPNASLSTSA
jgi:hypothetical protein